MKIFILPPIFLVLNTGCQNTKKSLLEQTDHSLFSNLCLWNITVKLARLFLSTLGNEHCRKCQNYKYRAQDAKTPSKGLLSKLRNWALSKIIFADNEEDLRQPCISDPWPCVYWEVSFKVGTWTATSLFDEDFTCLGHITHINHNHQYIWGMMRYVWLCITEVTSSIYLWKLSYTK